MPYMSCLLMGFGSCWGFKSAPKIGRVHPSELAPILRNRFGAFIALATLACSGIGMVVYTIWALSCMPGTSYLKVLAILSGQLISGFLWNRIRQSGSVFIYATDHVLGIAIYWATAVLSFVIAK